MKHLLYLLISYITIIGLSACQTTIDETKTIYVPETNDYEYLVTDYGAVGDGVTDCAEAFNATINALPDHGGVVLIPEGDFLIDSPIKIERNFVTIRGINNGLRSNVDVPADGTDHPGAGSRIVLGAATYGIQIPIIADLNGLKNRISGVTIENLQITGGTSNKGTGIYVQQDNDGLRINDVVCINLNYGIIANSADAMIISDCWISEVANSIQMTNGIQNMINNCQLGAQPSGITVKLDNQENFIFEGNHVYPDGSANLQLNNCTYVNVSNNNFQSYYLGMLELSGDNNIVNDNIIWMRNSSQSSQLRSQSEDYGVVRVSGSNNLISGNSISCDWDTYAVTNPVTVRCISGEKNRFSDILIKDCTSTQVFLVNETTEIFNCVPSDNVKSDGDIDQVYINY